MSRGVRDRDYKPKLTTAGATKSSRTKRNVEPVNYSETEEDDTVSESSEITLLAHESGFSREIKAEVDVEHLGEPETYWSPNTLTTKTTELSKQFRSLSTREMAREAETTAFERMMELMITMKQDDKIREERREREDREREAQREERQAELLAQLKAAQPVVL